MKLLAWVAKKTMLNWERPFYSKSLFILCSRYVDLWYGDNNIDRKTNGEFWLLGKLMPNVKTVFDVGANIGVYAKEILRINPSITIHAFEPDPRAYEELKKLPVRANNFALGERAETKTLYRTPRSTHNSFYVGESDADPYEVKVRTLDAYVQEHQIPHIDFLKIDVEGYEFFVLKGASETLSRGIVEYIQFEFSGGTLLSRVFLKDFIDLLDSYGYDLYRIRAKDVQRVNYLPDCERFTLTNYLAIKRGKPIPR